MPRRTLDEEDRAKIIQLHESGVPSSHIARRTGWTRGTVNAVIRKHGRKEARGVPGDVD